MRWDHLLQRLGILCEPLKPVEIAFEVPERPPDELCLFFCHTLTLDPLLNIITINRIAESIAAARFQGFDTMRNRTFSRIFRINLSHIFKHCFIPDGVHGERCPWECRRADPHPHEVSQYASGSTAEKDKQRIHPSSLHPKSLW